MASTSLPDEQIRIDHRDLIELLPDSILCRFDRQLRVVFASGDALHKLHHTPEELVGQSVQALLPQEAWAAVEARLRAALTGEGSRFEVTYPADEVLRLAVVPLREGDGGAGRHVLLLGTLVSGHTQAEDKQREHTESLEAAIQAANVGLWDWDLRTNQVHFSTEWKRQIGYKDDEIGEDFVEWESRLHPDDLQRAKQTVQSYVAAPWPNYQQEFRFRHKDGSYLHILAQAKMYHDKYGRPAHMYGSHVDITQAIAREEALRESEARYRTLFEENHSVMLLIHHETGDIFDANPAAAAFYGWTREQLRTMSIFDINAASPAEVEAEIQRAEAEQRTNGLFRHRLADGSLRDVEVYTSTVQLNGRVLRYAIAYDVTKRKQAEDALVRSEAALKRSQAVAHIGHWTWDTRSNTVTLSDELRHIVGLDSAMYAGDLDETIGRAIHPDDVERLRGMVSGVRAEQQVVEVECRVVWPDGSIHYVLGVPGDRTVDEQGNIVQLSGVVQDVTERKLREVEREQLLQQLQDKAEQLAQVMRSVPEGVLLLDNGSKILLANPRAEAMLALLATYDGEWRLAGLGGVALDALLISPPAGQWNTVRVGQNIYEVIARPVESGPVPGGWVLVLRDVTAELAVQEQLQRQERLAAVGQLAAGIAHDFNNIMSVISIYAELTSEAPGLTEKERARTTTIMDQAMRATRMIRQILDFSRQSVFERQVLDLLPLLKEQVKLLTQTLPESIEIELVAPPGECFVLADPTRMQQLVMNLAVNARDAMPEGGKLRIELEHFATTSLNDMPFAYTGPPNTSEGEWVQIVVQDTGMGIQPEIVTRIFDPFFTTKEPGKGTGLGLAQAHGIVAQHQGHIAVTSEVGVGTTFYISLPAFRTEREPGVTGVERPVLPQGQRERILVVEDDTVLRASLVELLRLWNYEVMQAANGVEAMSLLTGDGTRAGEKVDLIVSDVVMPRLGGIGLVKALRLHNLKTPVILMSGHPMGEEQVDRQELGVHAWLDKPPNSWLLAQAIAEALGSG